MKPKSLIAVAILLIVSASSPTSYAQESGEFLGGIAVGPTLLDVDVRPGEVWHGEFTIAAGDYSRPATFDIELMDLAQDRSGAKSGTERGTGVRSAAGWIEIPREMTVNRGEKGRVALVLRCPQDAFGCYSAFVMVTLRPVRPEVGLGAAVVPGIGVEILVRVRSQGPLHLDVESIEIRGTATASPTAVLSIRNTGVWKNDVKGDVLLYPESGGFPARAQISLRPNGQPFAIYPGQLLQLEATFPRGLPAGVYTAVARLDLGDRRGSRAEFSVNIGGGVSSGERDRRSELGTDLWLEETLFELALPPGAVRSLPIRLRNLGDAAIALDVTVEDARLESDGSWTFGGTTASVPGLSIEVTPANLVVEPKRTAVFRASVSMKKGTDLESTVVKAVRLTGSTTGGSVKEGWETIYDAGALVVMTPANQSEAKVDIVDLTLVRSRSDRNPGSAVLSIVNSGGATGHVKGSMTLKRTSGQAIATMTIGEEGWRPIMPGGRREFRMPLPLVDEGDFVVEAEIVQKDASTGPVRAEAQFTSTEATPEGLR
ncbi:hypothetical protein KAW64_10130 [bacterium]|nr:hypothetical protein [bacterium]